MALSNYFPLDIHLDKNVRLIEAEFGIQGFAIIVKLWQYIYGSDGYYGEWDEDVALLFSQENCVGGNVVSEVIKSALKRDIFCKNLYDNYGILTSSGIQKRYFNMCKRHKEITVIKEYLLINVTQILKDVNILVENVNIQEENVNISKQIREDKEDKIRLDYIREDKEENDVLSLCLKKIKNDLNINLKDEDKLKLNNWLLRTCKDAIFYAIDEAKKYKKFSFGYINSILESKYKDVSKDVSRKNSDNITNLKDWDKEIIDKMMKG